MNSLRRTISFIAFTLTEYARSGRILIELLVSIVFFYLFLWRWMHCRIISSPLSACLCSA